MRSNQRFLVLALGATIAAVFTGGCKKGAETKPETAEAELSSAETQKGGEKVVDERNAYFAVVRREQLELRARLQEEIDAIDKRLNALKVEFREGHYVQDPKSRNAAKIDELLEHRRQLEEDAIIVERADERGWDELKAMIERDLANSRPRGRI